MTRLSYLSGAGIGEIVNFVAAMIAIGAFAGGSAAVAARLLKRNADLADWTIYGSLLAGWFAVILTVTSWVFG